MARKQKRNKQNGENSTTECTHQGNKVEPCGHRNPSRSRRRRSTWEFQMIVEVPISIFRNHPLAGLTPEERQAARVKALGQVLASIAIRKTGQFTDNENVGVVADVSAVEE